MSCLHLDSSFSIFLVALIEMIGYHYQINCYWIVASGSAVNGVAANADPEYVFSCTELIIFFSQRWWYKTFPLCMDGLPLHVFSPYFPWIQNRCRYTCYILVSFLLHGSHCDVSFFHFLLQIPYNTTSRETFLSV